MRRTPFKPSKKGLRRSAFKSKGKTVLKRTEIKRRAPKINPSRHNQAYLDACRGERCYLRVGGVCTGESGKATVVPSHSNQSRHGKGAAIKAFDTYTVPGCFSCHTEIDQGMRFNKQEKFAIWDRAYERWLPVRARKLRTKENPATATTVLGQSIAPTYKGVCK